MCIAFSISIPFFENCVDPDQLASLESTQFSIHMMRQYLQLNCPTRLAEIQKFILREFQIELKLL